MTPNAATTRRVPWWVVVAVMLAAVLEVLDMTIVNVAMPHMLGTFGATTNQITWVLTAYLVSSAIVMPLTGYLSRRLGRQRLLIFAISGFIVASALCGLAWSLPSMVFFCLLQGVCGATLVPLSQSILFDAFPTHKRGQAMAVWGLGIMVAPILGPSIGGYLTETMGWRFVFYINLPIGLLALLLVLSKFEDDQSRYSKTDWVGLVLMVLAVGSLQFVLDQGETRNWLASSLIQLLVAVSLVAFAVFLKRGWHRPNHIVDLGLFRYRNFLLASLTILGFGFGMFGTIALLPLLTQSLLGYPADLAGALFIPRGIATGLTMMLVGGFVMRHVDPRALILAGLVIATIGTLAMARYSLEVDRWALIWPGIIQGVGMGLVFVPLSAIAFEGMPAAQLDEAAGLFGLMRSFGSSIGIAISSTLLARHASVARSRLSEQVTPYSSSFQDWFAERGLQPDSDIGLNILAVEIQRQAQMLAFVDLFWFLAWSFAALIPLSMLMRKPGKNLAALGVH